MMMMTRLVKPARPSARYVPPHTKPYHVCHPLHPPTDPLGPLPQTARQAATLADSFDKIKVKSLDLEFTVDPLFKKTSADFDEGGAGGILMNHLGTDGSMRVVFDAGDAKLEDAAEAEDEADEEGLRVDLSRLAGECSKSRVWGAARGEGRGADPVRNFGPAAKFIQPGMNWEDKTLCPSLSKFKFSGDSMLDLGLLDNPIDDILPAPAHHRHTAAHASAPGAHPVPFDSADAGADVFGGHDFGGGGDDDGGGGGEDFFSAEQWDEPAAATGASGFAPHDASATAGPGPTRASGSSGAELVVSHDASGASLFDVFDSRALKNWAGPEHWKMRRAPARADTTAGGDTTAASRTRREKAAFAIDFGAAPAVGAKELFAAGTAASLRAPRAKGAGTGGRGRGAGGRTRPPAAKEEEFVLPDDIHFSSQVLLRLFLKPKTLVSSCPNKYLGAQANPLARTPAAQDSPPRPRPHRHGRARRQLLGPRRRRPQRPRRRRRRRRLWRRGQHRLRRLRRRARAVQHADPQRRRRLRRRLCRVCRSGRARRGRLAGGRGGGGGGGPDAGGGPVAQGQAGECQLCKAGEAGGCQEAEGYDLEGAQGGDDRGRQGEPPVQQAGASSDRSC